MIVTLCRPKGEDGEVDVSLLAKACKMVVGETVDFEAVQSAFKKTCGSGKGSFGADDLEKVCSV